MWLNANQIPTCMYLVKFRRKLAVVVKESQVMIHGDNELYLSFV